MAESQLQLHLDGFEGPLDLLLELARAQKVDISTISILALVDQYIDCVDQARAAGGIRLELAAEWLVMAAWLAWLKSRLLVPEEERGGDDPEAAVEALTDRLITLERMRAASLWLGRRPWLGFDVFGRGAPENLRVEDRSGIAADLPALLQAYVAGRRRALALRPYRPKPRRLWSVQEALIRLTRIVGEVPEWTVLQDFLPTDIVLDPVERRAALASTLIAGLEMARGGGIELQQDQPFGPILLRRRSEERAADVRAA